MESEMKTIVEAALAVPCYEDAGTITYPSATVEEYLDSPELCGDGEEKSTVAYYQVDLWYMTRQGRDLAAEQLKAALKNNGHYTAPDVERFFDTDAQKYRATFKLSKIKEE